MKSGQAQGTGLSEGAGAGQGIKESGPVSGPAWRSSLREQSTGSQLEGLGPFGPVQRMRAGVRGISRQGREEASAPISGVIAGSSSGADGVPSLVPGERVGSYEIIKELGAGGMGIVLLARDERLGRRVAVKVLKQADPEFTRRFIIEAQTTAKCSHENIVVIYEVGEHLGSPFMALEYLQGQNLADFLNKFGKMPPLRVTELMSAVVRALVCAHEQGIVHRDLKPENIFLTDAGTTKVLDFGIAKVLQEGGGNVDARSDALRGSGGSAAPPESGRMVEGAKSGLVGTLAYMSPEQWGLNGEQVDHRSDIWAAGIILFEMLAGWHPLLALGADPYVQVIRPEVPMPNLGEHAPSVPSELVAVVRRCLNKSREDRYPDARALLRALEPFSAGRFAQEVVRVDSAPYAGLRAFQEEDAGRFFGRGREVAALVARIRDWPLLAIVGPSGVGKSSFVRAGVVPALKKCGEQWEILVLRPGRDPIASLASLLAPWVTTSSAQSMDEELGAHQALGRRLLQEPGYLGSALRARARPSHQRILVFVDQFEELYTLCGDLDARRAFTACLGGAADDATSPVRVAVSIRSDFLGRVVEDPHFMNELAKGLFFLGAPSGEGLRSALVQPAEMAGYRFESQALVDEMVRHLEATPGALPLLQFTASQLWETRDPSRKLLTEQSYRALGGVAGAFVTHADRVVTELASELRPLCRALFLHLVTPERTRAVRELTELRELLGHWGDLDRLVNHLVDARLLVIQRGEGGGNTTLEMVHESLIVAWPTLRRWLEESHEDSQFMDQLQSAARQWHAKKRDPGLLWGGEMVAELRRFRRRYSGPLPELLGSFSSAVDAQHLRRARRRNAAVFTGGLLLLALLGVVSVALVVVRRAQMQAEQTAEQAKRAEAASEGRLRQVETKERQRLEEEARRQEAERREKATEQEKRQAEKQVELSNEQIRLKNRELTLTLNLSDKQRIRAEQAKFEAEQNAAAARFAQEEARRSAVELERNLAQQRKRAKELEQQLKSALVEQLKR